MFTFTKSIEEARAKIMAFCNINNIAIGHILDTPVKGIKEFFLNRDQSGYNLSIEEVMEDLGASEAMMMVDDTTGRPVVLFDESQMAKLDKDDQVQIFIHELLHYNEALFVYENLCVSGDSVYDEAEDEIVSYLISLYPDEMIEQGMENLRRRINPKNIIEAYDDKEFARCMLQCVKTIERSDILRRFA